MITRVKKNCVAYEFPGEYKGVGRRPLHGKAVRLTDLFETQAASFQRKQMTIYGNQKQVCFLSRTLLWGQKLYQPLQFVLVTYDGRQIILAGTDLSPSPEDMIQAYAYLFKIEAMFRELKQQLGGFCYHFWTKAIPKLDRYRKKGTPDPLTQVTTGSEKRRILKAVQATEGYVMFACIAMGIIQMLCLKNKAVIKVSGFRYLRTPSSAVMSEASMMEYLRRDFFRFIAKNPHMTITKIISSKQTPWKMRNLTCLLVDGTFNCPVKIWYRIGMF